MRTSLGNCDPIGGFCTSVNESICDALHKVSIPTGEWWIREYEYFTCSECGYDYWNDCDCTEEAEERLRNGYYPNYCPNCGAKMFEKDGGEE